MNYDPDDFDTPLSRTTRLVALWIVFLVASLVAAFCIVLQVYEGFNAGRAAAAFVLLILSAISFVARHRMNHT